MKKVFLINTVIGIWNTALWAAAFAVFALGGSIYEPVLKIALTEMVLATALTIWLIYSLIRKW